MLGDDYATSEVVHHFLRSLTVKSEQDYYMPSARQSVGQHHARY